MAKIIIGKALPQEVYDEFEQMATQDTIKLPEEDEQLNSTSKHEVVLDVKNLGGNKIVPLMHVLQLAKEDKDDKRSNPGAISQEKSELTPLNKQAE